MCHGSGALRVRENCARASNYWTATENNTTNAWNVNMSSGSTNNNNKTNSNYVRCVRGDFSFQYRREIEVFRFYDQVTSLF